MAENGVHSKKISTPQRRAIAALLAAKSTREAAKQSRIAERTLTRWLAEDAAFVAELRQAEGAMLDAATRRLLQKIDSALDTLERIVTYGEDDSVRLRAANSVLTHVLKLRETRDIEARLSALEAHFAQPKR